MVLCIVGERGRSAFSNSYWEEQPLMKVEASGVIAQENSKVLEVVGKVIVVASDNASFLPRCCITKKDFSESRPLHPWNVYEDRDRFEVMINDYIGHLIDRVLRAEAAKFQERMDARPEPDCFKIRVYNECILAAVFILCDAHQLGPYVLHECVGIDRNIRSLYFCHGPFWISCVDYIFFIL